MGLQLTKEGTRQGLLSAVAGLNAECDPNQLSAVKALLASEINSIPAKFNGARIVVETEALENFRQVQVHIIPRTLYV